MISISNYHDGISCIFYLQPKHDALYHTFVRNVNIMYGIQTILSTIINTTNENFIIYHIFHDGTTERFFELLVDFGG